MRHRSWIEIDTKALKENAHAVRSLLDESTALLGMVKANAYGHGLALTVEALDESVDWFGVDTPDEAVAVRRLSQKPILITGGLESHRAEQVVREGFHQFVSDTELLARLSAAAVQMGIPAHVHIKVDTGMSRQGVYPDGLLSLLMTARRLEGIHIAGIATHFANADDPADIATDAQLAWFLNIVTFAKNLGIGNVLRHTANSAGTLTRSDAHLDLVRTGIALYGIWPSREVQQTISGKVSFIPALSFKTKVVQLKEVPSGSRVGYGLTETLARRTRIAVLPVGYADGYDRKLSRSGEVSFAGRSAKVLGNVSMDITTVDVTDIKNVHVGDTVELLGLNVLAEDVAEKSGTIPYEVVARLRESIPRIALKA